MNPLKLVMSLAAVATILLACGGSSSNTASTSPTAPGGLGQAGGQGVTEICHQAQKRIDILLTELEFHLEHGDWLIGPEICDGIDNNCDGHVDEGCTGDGGDDGKGDGGPSDGGGDGGDRGD